MIINATRRKTPFNSFLEKLKNDFIEVTIPCIFLKLKFKK
jgi:hypothetical protein